jgi:hypothetical protein
MARKNVTQARAKAKVGKDENSFDHDLWYEITARQEEKPWPEKNELTSLLIALYKRMESCNERLFAAVPPEAGFEHLRALVLKSTGCMEVNFSTACIALNNYVSSVHKVGELAGYLEKHIQAVRGAKEAA